MPKQMMKKIRASNLLHRLTALTTMVILITKTMMMKRLLFNKKKTNSLLIIASLAISGNSGVTCVQEHLLRRKKASLTHTLSIIEL